MGLSQALYSGVSGLINHNRCMDNIGNNIANVNTTGFKKGVFQFSTILEQTYRGGSGADGATGRGSTNPISLGLGTQTASIMKDFTQGPLETTNNPKHMAISGNGFFALQYGNGIALTRDGNFYLGELQVGSEKQTVLMANGGMPVLGYRANDYGVISASAALESLQIEIGQTGGAHETTSITFGGNLNSNQLVAMGTRIVDGTMTNPPAWLGDKLETVDNTWAALQANAAADIPSVVNGGNVVTSGALGTVAWRVSEAALDKYRQAYEDNPDDPAYVITANDLEKVHISLDGSLNNPVGGVNYQYFKVDADTTESRDATTLAQQIVDAVKGGADPVADPGAVRGQPPTNGLGTALGDVYYHDGSGWVKPYAGIKNGDEITISWQVGAAEAGAVATGAGVRTVTATFVYNDPAGQPLTLDKTESYTLEHFMNFLAGDIDSPTIAALQDRYDDGLAAGYHALAINADGDIITARVDMYNNVLEPADEEIVELHALFHAEEDRNAIVTNAGWRVDPATGQYLDRDGQLMEKGVDPDTGQTLYYQIGDDTSATAFQLAAGVPYTVALDPEFDASDYANNQRLVGGAMGLVKVAPMISVENGGTDAYDAPAESAGAYTRLFTNAVAYNKDGVPQDSFNLSLLSNLGMENAISNVNISFNNVTHNKMFRSDTDYFSAEGGGEATTIDVYDSLGTMHTVNLRLTLVARDTNFSTWRWIADSPSDTDNVWGSDEYGEINTNALVGTGLIRFDADGRFVPGDEYSETYGVEVTREMNGTNNPIQVALANGAATDFVQSLNFRYLTQQDSTADFGVKEQDGRAPGQLTSFQVSEEGTIHGVYNNGHTAILGRLALAMVTNENGLVAAGNNLFFEGAASGQVMIAMANTGGRGLIRQGQLETSNVDLAEEFTKLITTERGYQANARTISTVDEMLQELLNLKR